MKCLVALLIFSASGLFAVTGRVQTTNGLMFEGEIGIDAKLGLVVTNAESGTTNLPLSSLLLAEFNSTSNLQTNQVSPVGTLPVGWTNQDVGHAGVAGKAQFENGLFTLSSSGARLWAPEPDEFHFAYRRFTGNGQLVAQVTKTEGAMAGVMFRRSLEPNSQFVMEAATEGPEGLIFRSRRDPAHRQLVHMQGDWLNRDEVKPPCWVKLIRKDKRVTAYKSDDDGITWQPIYDSATEWDREIFAGVFVMGGNSNSLKRATFANVVVEDEVDYKAKSTNDPAAIQVFLNDGSVLAVETVSADQSKMKIALQGTDCSASVFAVARIVFRPVPERLKRELAPGRQGVLLNTGDFFEGELRLLDKEQVKVASILFGPRTFPYDKVLAVTLSQAIEMPAHFVVRTLDGSVIRAKAVAAGPDSLIAEELKLGPLQLPLGQLAEVRRADIPVRSNVHAARNRGSEAPDDKAASDRSDQAPVQK